MEQLRELSQRGFAFGHGVLSAALCEELRLEAERVAQAAGSVNVRAVRGKSALFRALADSAEVRGLLPADLAPVRSILFDKTPGHNWPVAWHQDLTIAVAERRDVAGYGPWSEKDGVISVQPPAELLATMVTIRLNLDPCGEENGALWVIPESHKDGRLVPEAIAGVGGDNAECCACAAGDALLMRPLLLHASKRAVKPSRRRILHLEYAPLAALHPQLSWYDERVG